MKAEQPLVDRYLDGELTLEEQDCLAEWLAADAEHIRQFVRETSLHRHIRDAMLARPYRAIGLAEEGSPEPKARPASVSVSVRRNQAGAAADVRRRISGRLSALSPRRLQFERAAQPFLLALAASIVLVAGVWFLGPTMGAPTLAEVNGVGLLLERTGRAIPAVAGTRLQSGDALRTPKNVTATISFAPENTRITIQPDTDLKLVTMARGKRFALGAGKLEATVARQRLFQPMVLITPLAEAQVLGTKFILATKPNATRLDVTEGKVKFTRQSDNTTVKVPAGYYAIAAASVELAVLPATGRILREVWTNYLGDFMALITSDATFSDHPNDWDYLSHFQTSSKRGGRFGQRVRGFVNPPMTGEYRFSIDLIGSGEAYLLLSPDDNPANRVQIVFAYTRPPLARPGPPGGSWSAPITLVAGRKYYIETLHESDAGDGQFTVRWQGPGREREVVAGEFLSPMESKAKEKKR